MFKFHSPWVWIVFIAFVLTMLVLDLAVLHRKKHAVGLGESLGWTAAWVGLSLAFALVLWQWGEKLGLLARGRNDEILSPARTAVLFLTAYLVEESLSMDNMFVFLVIFRYFAIPREYQHGVLFWGILGALVMRLTFILAGVALLRHFEWVGYLFGAILLWTGVQMWRGSMEDIEPEKNLILRCLRRVMPISAGLREGRFFVREAGRLAATPLLVALLVIETTDVVFAVDSVPAVLTITQDPFIAFSSNVFAILGLRSLYFALAAVMGLFKDLHYGLAVLLVYLGAKMIASATFHLPEYFPWISLAVVFASLGAGMLSSVIRHRGEIQEELREAEAQQPATKDAVSPV